MLRCNIFGAILHFAVLFPMAARGWKS